MAKKRVGILFGGKSVEHEVSLQSARNVYEAVDQAKFDVVLIGIDKAGQWHVCDAALLGAAASPSAELAAGAAGEALALVPGETERALVGAGSHRGLPRLDVVFPVLHGTYGEDGTVQGLLKLANVPFVGAGVLGSAVGMDKDVAKRVLRDAGMPVCALRHAHEPAAAAAATFEELAAKLGAPFFVKPANSGSSVGREQGARRRGLGRRADRRRCATTASCSWRSSSRAARSRWRCSATTIPQASVPGEIVPQHEFYSYEAKYLDENGARAAHPGRAAARRERTRAAARGGGLQDPGVRGHGAGGFFRARQTARAYVNEINTIPGFTKISMYPKLWEATGVPYAALIERLLELAIERFEKDQRLRTSYRPGTD